MSDEFYWEEEKKEEMQEEMNSRSEERQTDKNDNAVKSADENSEQRIWRVNSEYVNLSQESEQQEPSQKEISQRQEPQQEVWQSGYVPQEPGYPYQGSGSGYQMPEQKKSGSFGKKLAGVVLAAATFGVVAGGIVLGSEYLTRNINAPIENNQDAQANAGAQQNPSGEEQKNDINNQDAINTPETGGATLTKDDSEISSTQTVTATLLDVSPVVEEVIPTVVSVTNTTIYTSTGGYFNWYGSGSEEKASGAGSGVIIAENDTELLIVTNAHVVIPEEYMGYTVSSFDMTVTFCDDVTVDAYIKGTDEEADLAVIAVKLDNIEQETLDAIKIATIGDSDALKVGNGVIAIGNALGFGQSVTVGYVSALERQVTINGVTRTLLQTDAAINPGNSGGGLFDINGRLVGINSAKYSSEQVEGIGYAIPITSAEDIITELMNMVTVVREPVTDASKMSYLGVETNSQYTNFYDGQGAYIVGVTEGGPAEAAGLMAYDIIIGLNDKEITTWNELVNELSYYEGGETVTVTYLTIEVSKGRREYVEKTCEVTLGFKADYVDDVEEN